MLPDDPCACGCTYRHHVATVARGGVVLVCRRCAVCDGYAVPAEPTPVSFVGTAERPAAGLIGAWRSWWCPTCGETAAEPLDCHGEPMVAVRVELHPRGAET